MTITWKHFGPWLRRVRTRQGLSQERLAHLLDYDRIYLWRLEKGERLHPSRKFLTQLRRTLTLAPTDARILDQFIQMADSHCDHTEVDDAGRSASRAAACLVAANNKKFPDLCELAHRRELHP
jgi:transcriptional regulator with XRE-family HTH domain